MSQPSEDELRASLASLDDRQKKIVGGVLAVMFPAGEKVKDREWIAEQFTEVVLLTGGFEEASEVEAYVKAQIHPLLNAAYAVYARTAQDLAPRLHEGLGPNDALGHALGYFGEQD